LPYPKLANVISFVGPSGSGKTTLICRLLDRFQTQGLKVAVLKHSHKAGLGDQGKDTGQFRRAGAQAVALAAPGLLQISRFFPGEPPLTAALAALAAEVDLVLVEGYKTSSLPKIAFVGPTLEKLVPEPSDIVALVSPAPVESPLPVFHPRGIPELASFIKEYLGLP
jgi:molybdopterin-guanine dinucleotide biosynthesis protein B